MSLLSLLLVYVLKRIKRLLPINSYVKSFSNLSSLPPTRGLHFELSRRGGLPCGFKTSKVDKVLRFRLGPASSDWYFFLKKSVSSALIYIWKLLLKLPNFITVFRWTFHINWSLLHWIFYFFFNSLVINFPKSSFTWYRNISLLSSQDYFMKLFSQMKSTWNFESTGQKTRTVFTKALTTITTKDLIRNIKVCLKHLHGMHRISEFSYVITGYHYTEALGLLKNQKFSRIITNLETHFSCLLLKHPNQEAKLSVFYPEKFCSREAQLYIQHWLHLKKIWEIRKI